MTLLAALVFPVGWASAQAAAAAALVAPRRLAVLLGEFAMFAIPTVTTFVTFHWRTNHQNSDSWNPMDTWKLTYSNCWLKINQHISKSSNDGS